MGWSFSGRCYTDTNAVLNAFNLQYPMVDGSSANYLESSSITGTPPVITYSVQSRQWSGDAVGMRTGSMTLQSCTVTGLDQYDLQSIIFPVVIVFAFLIGWNKSAVI